MSALPLRSVALRGRLLLALALLAASGAGAAPPIIAVEHAVETSARQLPLPSGGIGTISLQACVGCPSVTLLAGTGTRWILGAEAVDAAEFRRALAAQPNTPVVVLYRPASREITRVIAQARATGRSGS